ncbi:hypothetical protein T492DRAFT_1136003 [Pavlovales sp. CCMP2436]|nr:hypothetical protein T492DRAFT_1136003 [Pavlovales sp. CCMP2436]
MELVASSYLSSSSTPVDPASAMEHLQSLHFNATTSQQARSDGGGASSDARINTGILLATLGHGPHGTPGGLQIGRRALAQMSPSTTFPSHAAIKNSVMDAPPALTQVLDADAAVKVMRGTSLLSQAVCNDLRTAKFSKLLPHVLLQEIARPADPFDIHSGAPANDTHEFLSRGLGNVSVTWLNKLAVPLCEAVGAKGLGELDRIYHAASLISLHPMLLSDFVAIVQLGFSEIKSALSLMSATFSPPDSDSASRLDELEQRVVRSAEPARAYPQLLCLNGAAGSAGGESMGGGTGSAAGTGALTSKHGGKRPVATALPASKRLVAAGAGNPVTTMVLGVVPASLNLATSMHGTVAFYVAQHAYSRSSIIGAFLATNGCELCLPVVTSVNGARAQGRCTSMHLPGHANMKGAAHAAVDFSLASHKLVTPAVGGARFLVHQTARVADGLPGPALPGASRSTACGIAERAAAFGGVHDAVGMFAAHLGGEACEFDSTVHVVMVLFRDAPPLAPLSAAWVTLTDLALTALYEPVAAALAAVTPLLARPWPPPSYLLAWPEGPDPPRSVHRVWQLADSGPSVWERAVQSSISTTNALRAVLHAGGGHLWTDTTGSLVSYLGEWAERVGNDVFSVPPDLLHSVPSPTDPSLLDSPFRATSARFDLPSTLALQPLVAQVSSYCPRSVTNIL